MNDGQGAQLSWSDWSALSVGRIWAWILSAAGVLAVVVGALLFSPDMTNTALGAFTHCVG